MEEVLLKVFVSAFCIMCSLAGIYISLKGRLNGDGITAIVVGSLSTIFFVYNVVGNVVMIVPMLLIQIGAMYIAGMNTREIYGTDYVEKFKKFLNENPVFIGFGGFWKK